MSSVDESSESTTGSPSVKAGEARLEVVVVPVSDVDRARRFYEKLGWRLDADLAVDDGYRVVQLTPPGSGCSIIFGEGVTSAPPGSSEGLQLTVNDIAVIRQAALNGRKVVVITDQRHGVKLYIANTGAAYPLRADLLGPHPQRIDFTSYGANFHITAPPNAISAR